ncbi:MAG: copper ion binding protein [Ignavibacteriales bacterium]|nr:copper ion binding protein [Ignavibacteriales bacterium]
MRQGLKSITGVLTGLFMITAATLASSSNPAGERITLRVDGLSCPFCAYGLEKNVKSLDGVSNLDIKVNDGIATFDVKSGVMITDDQLKKVVKDAGFTLRDIKRESLAEKPKKGDGRMEVINLDVQGMRCSGCVYGVETALKEVSGVHSVDVDLDERRANVSVERGKVNPEKLINAIEKAGRFKASIAKEQ